MKIEVYTIDNCMYCTYAKNFLLARNLKYEEVVITVDNVSFLRNRIGDKKLTAPQIFIDNVHVGGYTDLLEWFGVEDIKEDICNGEEKVS